MVILSPFPSGRGVGVRENEPSATVPAKPNQFAVKCRYSGNEPAESLFGSGNVCFLEYWGGMDILPSPFLPSAFFPSPLTPLPEGEGDFGSISGPQYEFFFNIKICDIGRQD